MKLKYVGESFGIDGLTNGKVYIATIFDGSNYRVFDDSGEDYIYPSENPRPCDGSSKGGRWEIVENMNEQERELLAKIKRAYAENAGADTVNRLLDETEKICKEYATTYKKEIEENMVY